TRATSKLMHYLYNSHRFEILELRDNGEVAKALQTRPSDPRADPRATTDNGRTNMLSGGLPRLGAGNRQMMNQPNPLLSLAGGTTSAGGGFLSLLTGQLLGGVGPMRKPQDKKPETEFETSGAALTLKDAILKEAKEQGADAILIGEVL